MSELDRYLEAAERDNTRRSYRTALAHYELVWGGLLPSSGESVARYLACYAESLSTNTLRHRLAALARWHRQNGFSDPTKTELVRQVFKGIRALHPNPEKQAVPLQLQQLEAAVGWLESQAAAAQAAGQRGRYRRSRRDRALILLGFWRAFRSDELCRLRVELIQARAGEGMELFLPQSKADRENLGVTYKAPALQRLCPVQAYLDWLEAAPSHEGPVFRAINRWGQVKASALHPNSVIPILRQALQGAGVDVQGISSHSLRRGFATWATRNGWNQKALMEYVGWRDAKSALRYIEAAPVFPLSAEGGVPAADAAQT
ncbi:site-specific integrase [Pseudomonas sp. BN417]|uniref:site-specific integrase n=1 Tax=Pseudomonas sp. BN417 TaxID=2567890 RepID=UPI002458730D|nr:site-specific integrase [Pseudomonas sp. BN417]MDH4556961.1 site-specific integrase [Pseudomonas sp. BN417]